MMDFIFIYIFILLTSKFEIGRVHRQLLSNHQAMKNRHQWRGKKIDSGCDILSGQLSHSPTPIPATTTSFLISSGNKAI